MLQNLQLLEKDNERLSELLRWREEEDIFWKWMVRHTEFETLFYAKLKILYCHIFTLHRESFVMR